MDDKEALKAELDESLETVGIRIRGLEKQEKDLRAKYEMLQSNINNAMGGASARSASRAAAKRSDDDEEDE